MPSLPPTYAVGFIREAVKNSAIEELTVIGQIVDEERDRYAKDELIEILTLLSDRIILLCDGGHIKGFA